MSLFHDYGHARRQFSKHTQVTPNVRYKSCLFLVYEQFEGAIANLIKKYRHHFNLFVNDDSVLIALNDTNYHDIDNESTIMYFVITVSGDINNRWATSHGNWRVSFDKEFVFETKCPNFILDKYRLLCSGEWWYFDKGYVLNGLSAFDANRCRCPSSSFLIYFEFHTDCSILQANNCATQNRTFHIKVNYHDPPPQVPLTPFMTPIQPKLYTASPVPSLSWFQKRQDELTKGNISYFTPLEL